MPERSSSTDPATLAPRRGDDAERRGRPSHRDRAAEFADAPTAPAAGGAADAAWGTWMDGRGGLAMLGARG